MARPQKSGLDYFALDVDMNDEVELIEAEHGLKGFAILIKLFQKIYSEGYYYPWEEKEQLLFSKRVSVDRNKVTSIVGDCIKWGIFSERMYEKYQILTSKRIQNQYFTAVYKRVGVEAVKEYLLIDVSDKTNLNIFSVSDDGNSDITIVSDDKSTQSKVKESKVKESKVKESRVEEELSATIDIENVFSVFEKNIHLPTPIEIEKLKSWLNDFDEEVIIMAIEEAVNRNARNMAYINAILNNWENEGLKTKDNVLSFKRDKADKNKKQNTPVNKDKLDMDHSYDIDDIEQKLLKKSRGG